MGDGEYPVILCHGQAKHEVTVSPEMTLHDFMVKVEGVTHVPHTSQKILFKGRNLTDRDATLSSLSVGCGAKLMILGKKFDPLEDTGYQAVAKIDQSVSHVEETLHRGVVPEVESIAGGSVDGRQCGEALGRLRKSLLGVNEQFMRLLEQLDGLQFEETQLQARQKRKSVVKRIQMLMEESDQVQEHISQLSLRYS